MGKIIDEFLNQYSSKNTKKVYRNALNKYFKILNTADQGYFTKNRDYEKDIKTFFKAISQHPPKTVRTYLGAAKMFLSENDIDFPEKFWRNIRRKVKGSSGKSPVSHACIKRYADR